MKTTTLLTLTLSLLITLISCGGGAENAPATEEGFASIEDAIKKEFGSDAYFTNLNIMYDEAIGNMISVTVTDDPESLKMGEWNQAQGAWTQSAEIFLELPPNSQAIDFMYQLGEKVSLKTLGALVEESKEKLEEDKGLANPLLSMASVLFPDNGDYNEAKYIVNLEPETGGTTFSFYYDLSGEFLEMDY